MARKKIDHYAVFQSVAQLVSIVVYYHDGGSDTLVDLDAAESNFIVNLLRNEKPIFYDHVTKRIGTDQFEPVGENEGSSLDPLFTLEHWLSQRVQIREAIKWQFSDGTIRNYSSWTSEQKEQLAQNYRTILNNQTLGLDEAPPLSVVPGGGERAMTKLSATLAWNYYLGYVAQTLVMEGDKRVNWSLNELLKEGRNILLDGRSFFVLRPDLSYEIDRHSMGCVTYGDPVRLYRFLLDHNLIGPTPYHTIVSVIGWCRRMIHYEGYDTVDNLYDHWQYRGWPPIERVIRGTTRISRYGPAQHWTAGCSGTTGFLRTLLRVVNIPVQVRIIARHTTPYFMSIERHLSHGDDPYNGLFRYALEIPIDALLLDYRQFNRWFTDHANPIENVGRQPKELALQYLPEFLLQMHCGDLAADRSHAESEVAELYQNNYTIAQLEAMGLWNRMNEKIATLGGCSALP